MTSEYLNNKIKEAREFYSNGENHTAEVMVNEVLQQLETYPGEDKEHIRVVAFDNLSKILLKKGENDLALDYLHRALQLAEKLENEKLVARICGSLGLAYYDTTEYTKALTYMQQALELSREHNLQKGIVKNLTNIAILYIAIADYPRALEYHGQAKELYERLGQKRGIQRNLQNTGVVYSQLGDHEQAIIYYHQCIKLTEEMGHEPSKISVYNNMGISYLYLKKYEEALQYFEKGLDIAERFGNKIEIGRISGNIGTTYLGMRRYNEAYQKMQTALDIAGETNNTYQRIHWLMGLGQMYAEPNFSGHNDEVAIKHLNLAIEESVKLGVLRVAVDSHEALYKIYRRQERWQDALVEMEKMRDVRERMNMDESTKRAQLFEHNRKLEEAERNRQVKLARFQEQEKILYNILPAQIAERILEGEKGIADYCEGVSVFFSDIVGFTKLSQNISPQQLVTMLNNLFSEFDRLAKKHGLEKIKTIGDAYMAVAGVPVPQADHAQRAANFALDVQESMLNQGDLNGTKLQIRIGLHTGQAVAGIIGETKFAYDLWGDAVNTASRMESHGEAGKIHVSRDFYNALQATAFNFVERGEMDVKGKGVMKTYFLTGR